MQRRFGLVVVLWLGVEAGALAQAVHGRGGITLPAPPPAEATPVLDNYFDTKIPDSYRWLEDAKSAETRAFIDAENAYTTHYLKQARIRPQVVDDLESLEQVSSWTLPIQRAGNYYFMKRLAGEGQASIYMRRGWTAKDERLIDPAVLSRDPNTSVELADVSRDGTLIAYRVRQGGADETTVRVFNVKTSKILEGRTAQRALLVRRSSRPTATASTYSQQQCAGHAPLSARVRHAHCARHALFGHEFYDEPLGPNDLITAPSPTTAAISSSPSERGVPAKRVDIVFRDLTKPGSPFKVLVWGTRFALLRHLRQGRVVREDRLQSAQWAASSTRRSRRLCPSVEDRSCPKRQTSIHNFSIVGGKVYVKRLKDVKSETQCLSRSTASQPATSTTRASDPLPLSTGAPPTATASSASILHSAAHHLPPRYSYRQTRESSPSPEGSLRHQPIRTEAGLLQVQGRHADSHVHRRQEGPEAGRHRAPADDRLRRLQRQQHAGMESGMGLVARAGRLVRRCPTCAAAASMASTGTKQGMFEKKQNVFDDWFCRRRLSDRQ